MEDSRKYPIAEHKFPYGSGDEYNFLLKTYHHFIKFCESLASSFFSGHDTEVQRNILRSNFGLSDEDINSWKERASRYNMSTESFTFFLHIAISSAVDGFQARRKELETFVDHVTKYKETSSKKSKKIDKKKKKSNKSKHRSIINSDVDSDELDDFLDKANEEFAHLNFSSDDRDSNINRPIATASGSKMDVDHPINTNESSNTVLQSVPNKPQSQPIQIPEKSITDSTKSSNKNKKLNKHLIEKVITGHKPADDDTSRVRDILVYDVPVSWTAEYILQQLTLWGKPIDIQMKQQRKYQTVRLKIELSTLRLAQFEVNENPVWTTDLRGIPVRWFPARWTLKERKQREKFQATIRKIPDSMTYAALWVDHLPHTFLSSVRGLKSFKIIQTARGERKLIGYFEKWVDMRNALDNQFVWDLQNLSWNRYEPPMQQTRSHGSNANKNQGTSRSQSTNKHQRNSKNSKKKPEETKSEKPKKHKKDKSRKSSRSKVLAEVIDVLRKLII
ncbi:hypothetical protein GLOIN_2v1662849 [Rhizophagus irregularis DAOM 181602=DAOM 197198]|nr:hypothetical protein GLOIN_2v1662849 [Rhizophagus irregularis DAOM 181602=DAOM 197198]